MDLFTYLMAKNGNNSSVHGDLFSYLLGKGQSQTQTISGVTIYIPNAKKLVSFMMTKESTQATSILPSGYTQVDYIESSGTQYIDTGYILNDNFKIMCKGGQTATGGVFLGERISSTNGIYIGSNQGKVTLNIFNSIHRSDLDIGSINEHILTSTNWSINGNVVDSYTISNYQNLSLYLFSINTNGTVDAFSSSKIYYFKIYENNVLVRDFIPCYRNSDNEVGLYDLVNNVFYTNQGTGAFTYGSVAQLPNPDYPIEVNTVKGYRNEKDLYNTRFIPQNNGVISYEDEKYTITAPNEFAGGRYLQADLLLKPNTTYTFSAKVFSTEATNGSSVRIAAQYTSDNTAKWGNYAKAGEISYVTFTTPSTIIIDNNSFIGMFPRQANTTTVFTDVMLVEGDQKLPYVPYGNNYIYTKIVGKNLNTSDLERGGISSTGENQSNNSYTRSKDYIALQPNTEYTISSSIQALIGLRYYDKNKNFISTANATAQPKTFTTPENCYYFRYVLTINDLTNLIQIEEGSTATSYESYKENIIPIPLNNNEIVGIGDYKDELKVDKSGHVWLNKKIAKYIISGNENWQYYANAKMFYYTGISNYLKIENTIMGLSNYYPVLRESSGATDFENITNDYNYAMSFGYSSNTLRIKNIDFINATDFKNWLSTYKPYIYFIRETPELIDLQTTVDLKLFKGVNNVSNSEGGYMTIEYK